MKYRSPDGGDSKLAALRMPIRQNKREKLHLEPQTSHFKVTYKYREIKVLV